MTRGAAVMACEAFIERWAAERQPANLPPINQPPNRPTAIVIVALGNAQRQGLQMIGCRPRATTGHLRARIALVGVLLQWTRWPGTAPVSGDNRKTSVPPAPLAQIMPWLSPNFICRGFRLATQITSRPTRSSGL